MNQLRTTGWVVFRRLEDEIEFLGIYETRAKADLEIQALARNRPDKGWEIKGVAFIGWGIFLTDNNDPVDRGSIA